MYKKGIYTVTANEPLTPSVWRMTLEGDTQYLTRPGQFVNIEVEGLYLRRPISVCDYDERTLTLIYKVVGEGTARLSEMKTGEKLDLLTGLGNGFDPDAECRRYDRLIADLGGIDLQLLGIGRNAHIGFNEPGEAFDKQVHCVNLPQSTIEANKRFFASADDLPKQAYTKGIKTIMQAKKILIVASCEDKAEIVRDAFFGPITPKVPASVLQLHNDVTLVADEAALSKLPL